MKELLRDVFRPPGRDLRPDGARDLPVDSRAWPKTTGRSPSSCGLHPVQRAVCVQRRPDSSPETPTSAQSLCQGNRSRLSMGAQNTAQINLWEWLLWGKETFCEKVSFPQTLIPQKLSMLRFPAHPGRTGKRSASPQRYGARSLSAIPLDELSFGGEREGRPFPKGPPRSPFHIVQKIVLSLVCRATHCCLAVARRFFDSVGDPSAIAF